MKFFPEATYVLYEPQPVHSDALDAFAESCKGQVLLIKKAVGGSEGHAYFDATDAFGGKLPKNSRREHNQRRTHDDRRPYGTGSRSRGALPAQIRYARV